LPLEVIFFLNIAEYSRSGSVTGPASGTAPMTLSGAGSVASWEGRALFLIGAVCVFQLLAAGVSLVEELVSHARGCRRLLVVASALAPLCAVALGVVMANRSVSLQPVVSGGVKDLATGVTHVYYSRRGHPLLAALMDWGGWAVGIGGWATGTAWLGRAGARSRSSTGALRDGAWIARLTAFTQSAFALCACALVVTMAFQAPLGRAGGMDEESRLGPWALPVVLVIAGVAALSFAGARAARQAVARSERIAASPAAGPDRSSAWGAVPRRRGWSSPASSSVR
jgi:hypothetical protein